MSLRPTVLVCDVALDRRNGAGMRAILPYLESLKGSLTSLYLLDTGVVPSIPGVKYVHIPYRDQPRKRLISLMSGAFRALKKLDQPAHFIILTNSIRDVLLGLVCKASSRKGSTFTVWVMDDFAEKHRSEAGLKNRVYSRLFQWLYRSADKRVVVAKTISDHYESLYGIPADQILGRTLLKTVAPKRVEKKEGIRLVYVGSFLNYYVEPIVIFKKIARRLPFRCELDLYGVNPPGAEWLDPEFIHYKGALPDDRLLETLNHYDYGLVPYSFTDETLKMMTLSFPSKLIDYLGASLPVLVFAPGKLAFLKEVGDKNIGRIETELTEESMIKLLSGLVHLDPATYRGWQEAAQHWANQDFLVDSKIVSNILG
jgi:hypothetical protein